MIHVVFVIMFICSFIYTFVSELIINNITLENFNKFVISWTSNPFTCTIKMNMGKESFLYQALMVELYHEKIIDRIIHATLFFDGPVWLIVSYHYFKKFLPLPDYILMLCFLILITQANSFKDQKFFIILTLVWMLIFTITINVTLTDNTIYVFELFLLFNPFLRSIGHSIEMLPPYMLPNLSICPIANKYIIKRENQFRHIKSYIPFMKQYPVYAFFRLFIMMIVGTIAEFQAGFPYRLFPIIIYISSKRIYNYKSSLPSLDQLKKDCRLIRDHGFENSNYKEFFI